jgi:hypothetical protein
MSPIRAPRIETGASAVKGLRPLAQPRLEDRDIAPTSHVFPPPNSDRIQVFGYIAIPAAGPANQAQIIQYQVPGGTRFYLSAIVLDTAGSTVNTGDVLFTVDVNVAPGVAGAFGNTLEGLLNVPFNLGSFAFGTVWPMVRYEQFEANDIIRAKVTNVSAASGFPSVARAAFLGYTTPSTERL